MHTAVTSEDTGKGLGAWEGCEPFRLSCSCRSLVSLFFSGWNKLPPSSRMMADVLKKQPLVKRCVMLLCSECDGHRVPGQPHGKGDPMVVVGGTCLGYPTLLGCFYSLTTRVKVRKCCCASFMDDRPRHQGHSALEQLMARPRTCRSPPSSLQVMSLFPGCQDGGLVSSLPNPGSGEH